MKEDGTFQKWWILMSVNGGWAMATAFWGLGNRVLTQMWSGGKKICEGIFNMNGNSRMVFHFYITICTSFPLCIKLWENQIRKSPYACRRVRTADSAILRLLIKLHLYCWGAINVESIQYLEKHQRRKAALHNTDGQKGRRTSKRHSFACQRTNAQHWCHLDPYKCLSKCCCEAMAAKHSPAWHW